MSTQLWTLAGIAKTIAHVRTMQPEYADYMAKKYANFLPGGKYA
jgi:hypothetical protein